MAFLFRLGSAGGFLAYEMAGMGLACLLILALAVVQAPVGLAAVVVVTALIIKRTLATGSVAISLPETAAA